MSEKELAEKAMFGTMVKIQVDLYEPFYKFMKEYLAFFGSKKTIADVCREMIYERIQEFHRELEQFSLLSDHLIEKGAWFEKWPHLGCVASEDKTEEE